MKNQTPHHERRREEMEEGGRRKRGKAKIPLEGAKGGMLGHVVGHEVPRGNETRH